MKQSSFRFREGLPCSRSPRCWNPFGLYPLMKKELIEIHPLASKSRSKVVLTLHRFRASESGSGSPRSNDCLFLSFDLIASLDSMGK